MLIEPFCIVYHVSLTVTSGEAQVGTALAREALAHLAASGKDENRKKERLAFLQCGGGSGLSVVLRVTLAATQLPARRQKIPGFLAQLLQPGAGALRPDSSREHRSLSIFLSRYSQAFLGQKFDPVPSHDTNPIL